MVYEGPRLSSLPACASAPPFYLPRVSPILRLPDELLLETFRLLPQADRISSLRVCSSLHFLVANALYSTVRVSGIGARRFFATISLASRFSLVYATFTRRLSYSVVISSDVYLTYPVFCQALIALSNLHTLALDVSSGYSEPLLVSFERYGLLRQRTLAVTRLFRASRGDQRGDSGNALEQLRCLRIVGDPMPVALLVQRDVCELVLSRELTYAGLNEICCQVYGSTYGGNITSLTLSLVKSLDMDEVLKALVEIFPRLTDLSLEQRGYSYFGDQYSDGMAVAAGSRYSFSGCIAVAARIYTVQFQVALRDGRAWTLET
ncbi:hypothetical protein C8R44DRAFT_729141 [Mycena epipterygia]|nr:hypothetical protein C8R44DRAFT_729141 [Mycena epipterygia]